MPNLNVSQVEVNNTTYDICDATARDDITAMAPVVLFDDDSATVGNTVTLLETAANFTRLTIYGKTNDGDYCSVDVWHPNGKNVLLSGALPSSTTATYLKARKISIDGTTIATSSNTGTNQVTLKTSLTLQSGDYIAITQVIGYR